MILRRTCKEVVRLSLLAEETPLPWNHRVAIRIHLWACATCPRFAAQLALMRRASAQWRRYSESVDSGD